MRTGWRLRARRGGSRRLNQLVAGLVALPLSALPFFGYANLTPEGRLVRDRAMVALWPPSLPALGSRQIAAAAGAVPRYEGAVMALAYHGIGSASDGEGGFVVSPARFAEHLATLRAAGMRAVTADQVARTFTGGPALPPRAVMISFDDGRSDAMLFADPLLAEARMSATMFVITGAASKPGVYYSSWEKLEQYARSGRWDLQAHTAELHREQKAAGGGSLPALTSLEPGESLAEYRARVRGDLRRASETLERHSGRRPQAFAYPFGAYGADRTNHPAIRQILREEVGERYAVAFHQDEQESIPLLTGGSGEDLLGLRRLEVQDWSGVELLGRVADAARRSAPPAPAATPGPDLLPDQLAAPTDPGRAPGAGPGVGPGAGPGDLLALPAFAPPLAPAAATAPGPSTTTAPSTTLPRPSPTSPSSTSPPPVSTSATVPATTTTAPPRPTTTTTAPAATTTTGAPTTTTRPGCRSRGAGKVCAP